jgi:hypothetical protein
LIGGRKNSALRQSNVTGYGEGLQTFAQQIQENCKYDFRVNREVEAPPETYEIK